LIHTDEASTGSTWSDSDDDDPRTDSEDVPSDPSSPPVTIARRLA
jgi:hypothetical protein